MDNFLIVSTFVKPEYSQIFKTYGYHHFTFALHVKVRNIFGKKSAVVFQDDNIMLPGEEGSGNGNAENIDDSESGDVNEDYGSGRFPQGE